MKEERLEMKHLRSLAEAARPIFAPPLWTVEVLSQKQVRDLAVFDPPIAMVHFNNILGEIDVTAEGEVYVQGRRFFNFFVACPGKNKGEWIRKILAKLIELFELGIDGFIDAERTDEANEEAR